MLTVAIASGDAASSAQLLASLQQTGLVKSVKQWAVPADKLPDPVDSLPEVVFLDLARDPEPYFQLGAQIHRRWFRPITSFCWKRCAQVCRIS